MCIHSLTDCPNTKHDLINMSVVFMHRLVSFIAHIHTNLIEMSSALIRAPLCIPMLALLCVRDLARATSRELVFVHPRSSVHCCATHMERTRLRIPHRAGNLVCPTDEPALSCIPHRASTVALATLPHRASSLLCLSHRAQSCAPHIIERALVCDPQRALHRALPHRVESYNIKHSCASHIKHSCASSIEQYCATHIEQSWAHHTKHACAALIKHY